MSKCAAHTKMQWLRCDANGLKPSIKESENFRWLDNGHTGKPHMINYFERSAVD